MNCDGRREAPRRNKNCVRGFIRPILRHAIRCCRERINLRGTMDTSDAGLAVTFLRR
jgi:hypothetical protein